MSDLGDQSTPWQWNLDLTTGRATETHLDDRHGDFPRVDDRRIGQRARYGYMAGLVPGPSPDFTAEIHKYDLDTGAVETHSFGDEAVHVFEPVFAPAGPDAAEDEGWIICLSHDDRSDVTTLNILEAQDFTGDPVAKVDLPRRIPFGAHGSWLPQS